MWRCHCGESNLNAAARCRACDGARLTHEDPDYAPPPRERPRTVRVSFFGLGADAPRGGDAAPPPAGRHGQAPRLLSPEELAAHYARSRRQERLTWIVIVAGALLAAGLLAWQVMRPAR